jgi:anti-anti-sigma regulatory factor
MNEQVKEVFEVTGLAGLVFRIFDSREEALKNFASQ